MLWNHGDFGQKASRCIKKPHSKLYPITTIGVSSDRIFPGKYAIFPGNSWFRRVNNTPLHVSKNHRPAPSLSRGLDGGGNVFYTPCLLLATSQRIALAAAAAAPPPVPLLPPPPPPSSAAFSPEFSLAILGNGSRIGDKPVRVSLKLGKAGSMGRVGASTAGRSEQVCRLRCSWALGRGTRHEVTEYIYFTVFFKNSHFEGSKTDPLNPLILCTKFAPNLHGFYAHCTHSAQKSLYRVSMESQRTQLSNKIFFGGPPSHMKKKYFKSYLINSPSSDAHIRICALLPTHIRMRTSHSI